MTLHLPDRIPDWLACDEEPPTEPLELWPEDVLTEAEWDSAWFDRQLANGRIPRRTAGGWTTLEESQEP